MLNDVSGADAGRVGGLNAGADGGWESGEAIVGFVKNDEVEEEVFVVGDKKDDDVVDEGPALDGEVCVSIA